MSCLIHKHKLLNFTKSKIHTFFFHNLKCKSMMRMSQNSNGMRYRGIISLALMRRLKNLLIHCRSAMCMTQAPSTKFSHRRMYSKVLFKA